MAKHSNTVKGHFLSSEMKGE